MRDERRVAGAARLSLRFCREAFGVSLRALADAAGITKDKLWRAEGAQPSGQQCEIQAAAALLSLYNGGQVRCVSNSRKVRITEFLIGLLDTGAGESGRIQNDGAAGNSAHKGNSVTAGTQYDATGIAHGVTS